MKSFKHFCISALFIFSVAPTANSACYDTNENYGKVSQLYPQYSPAGTFFNLKLGSTNALSPGDLYHISTTASTSGQAVYRSIQDLLVEAAKNDWTVKVRTKSCEHNSTNSVEVLYIMVDY